MLPTKSGTVPNTSRALGRCLAFLMGRIMRYRDKQLNQRACLTIKKRWRPYGMEVAYLYNIALPTTTQEAVIFRMWLLNYQITHDMALITRDLDSKIKTGPLNRRLCRVIHHAGKTSTCIVDMETRQVICSLASELRQHETSQASMESGLRTKAESEDRISEQQFCPSPLLRRVERNLFVLQVLSMEFNLSRVLDYGMQIQYEVLAWFKYLKYNPGSTAFHVAHDFRDMAKAKAEAKINRGKLEVAKRNRYNNKSNIVRHFWPLPQIQPSPKERGESLL